jgi:dTMP kinase
MSAGLKHGIFISLEGIEGTGKTTQGNFLSAYLSGKGYEVMLTHEPGGTVIGGRIREVLLLPDHKEMSVVTELLLYNADRAQHLTQKIRPALEQGKVVITDRFSDSTAAYQGYGRGIAMSLIESMDKIATGSIRPNLTILFDLDVETGLGRNRKAEKTDRLELETLEFHKRVRNGFLEIAGHEPERFAIIDASCTIEEVRNSVIKAVESKLSALIGKA